MADREEHPALGPTFTWRVHPARSKPRRALATMIAILLISGLIFAICYFDGLSIAISSIVAAASLFILVIALNRFFFPSRFEIDSEKISAIHPLKQHQLQWDRVRRFLHDENGGYLSTRAKRSRLDAFQGMHLLFDELRRDEIQRTIENHISESNNATISAD